MKNWAAQIDSNTKAFTDLLGHLNAWQLNVSPNAYTWSIARNIDHLIIVNESYYPILDALQAGTYTIPFQAKIGFIVSWFGKMILNGVSPDRKRKMKTFPIWLPAENDIPEGILERFKKHHEELKQKMQEARVFVEKDVVISSPANKNIVYKLSTALVIIVTHELRHLEQVKELLNNIPSK